MSTAYHPLCGTVSFMGRKVPISRGKRHCLCIPSKVMLWWKNPQDCGPLVTARLCEWRDSGYTVAERLTNMPVEVVDITVVPKTIRNRTSPVKSSVEWQDTLKALPELKAKQAVKIEFSPATLKLAKNVPFTFKRLLQRHLKNEGLTGFTVFLRGKDSRGNNILYVKKTRQ